MQRFLFFFIFLLFANKIKAQDLEFEENCALFQDAKTNQPILILKDSILYKGYSLTKTKYNHTAYPDKLSYYIHYSIKGKTYLVHRGTGPVVEYRNDSIIACNKTPKFQNQNGATTFVFKNALHFFGGYGLFTYKNIVTKYDAANKDWVRVQTFSDEIPGPRSQSYSLLVNENLYVFGGIEENTENILNIKKCDNTVYRLHLPTMQWNKIGKFDSNFLGENSFVTFQANDKLYLISSNYYGNTYEIDIKKNTIKKFSPKTLIRPTQIYFDNTKKELVCISSITNGKYKFFKANLNSFLGKPIEESEFIKPFYKEITKASFSFGIGILLITLGIATYLRKNKKNRLLPFNGIVYKKETGNCYHKSKLIDNLEEPEQRILLYLLGNAMRFVSLNELNHLFENGNSAENFSAIVKRREIALATLLQKLSIITNIPKKELLINRKNPEDKRIKEIRISPSFLRIK